MKPYTPVTLRVAIYRTLRKTGTGPIALLILAATLQASVPVQDFGTQPLNAAVPTSTSITFGFTGVSGPALSVTGKDFFIGGLSCNSAFTTCTATVSFVPSLPGLRQDALTTKDTAGNRQIVTLLRGVGLAPQLVFFPGIISTFAGNGAWGYLNSASAAAASFRNPQGVASDAAANIYVADSINMVVRRIDALTGAVTTVAGNGAAGKSGDGGPALTATFNTPTSVAVDAAGNLYICDQGNGLIRKVDALSGLISTVAGGGTTLGGIDGLGDGLSATSAILLGPSHVALDGAGNIFIADSFHGLVRKVSAATGVITVVAGGGSSSGSDGLGDGGPATAASLNDPNSIALDASGNLYIADTSNSMIRMVSVSTGNISVVAGTGARGYSGDGGPATRARLSSPAAVTVDAAGNLYIADSANSLIRQVSAASGLMSTLAGAAAGYGGDGGPSNAAMLSQPSDLTFGADGNLYIADYSNNVIRAITFPQPPVTFAPANIGTVTPPSNILLSNIGNANLVITGLTFSSGFSQKPLGGTDCATAALPSGASCFVGVVFSPTSAGALVGSLKVASNHLNQATSSSTISLSGTGVSGTPQATLSFNSLTFATQTVGTVSPAQNVTLTNGGTSSLAVSSIWLSGTNAADFSLSANCPSSLAVSANCVTSITFKPLIAGTRTAVLTFSDSLASSPQTVTLTGTGSGGAVVSFNPASVNFGNLVVGGKSPAVSVVVTNNGTAGLSVYGIALSGVNGADFSLLSTTCGAPLNSSASCTLALVFSPSGLGSRSAGLLLTDSAGDSPQFLSLSGTGVAQPLSLTPASLSFGSQIVGAATAPQTVTVSNSSGASVVFNGLTFIGLNSADFSIGSNSCGPLPSGSSCSVSVTFTPTAAGPRSTALLFMDSAGNSPQAVALSGTGIAPASLSVTPSSLSFGSMAVGAGSAPQSITLTASSGAVTFTGLMLPGANSPDFSITGNTCPNLLASGASCILTLAFTPSAPNTRSAAMVLTDSAGNSPQSVSLSGIGLASPSLSVTPVSLSFGSLAVGTRSGPQSITLTASSGAVAFNGLMLAGANSPDFSITGNSCPNVLASGASCVLTLAFTPSALNTRSAAVVLADTAGNSPQSVALSGTGVTPVSSLSMTPVSLSFGSLAVGARSAPQSITLTASSGGVTFTGLMLPGANSPDFSITGNTCPNLLASGASCILTLAFTPSALNTRSAAMVLTDSAGNSPQSVSLSGTGIAPASLSVTPSSISFGSLAVGARSAPQRITLTASSGGVTFTGLMLPGANSLDFSITGNTCPNLLASGTSCVLTLAFTPSSLNTRSAAIVLTDSAGNSPQSISLSGTGIIPGASLLVTPSSLSFGSLPVGTRSAPQNITLSAVSGAVTFNGLMLAGANPTDFSVTGNTCPVSLGSGTSCVLTLAFTPNSQGARSAAIQLTDSAVNSPQSVSLSGAGAAAGPSLSVTPASLSFGSSGVGNRSAPQSIMLTAVSGPVTFSGLTIIGTNPADFSITANTCPSSLASDTSCLLSVAFTPAAAGNRSASLNVIGSASGSPQTIALTGNVNVTSQGQGSFQGFDTTTQGSWKSVYGSDGYIIAGLGSSLPAYATVSVTGASSYIWNGSTNVTPALQKPDPATDRIISAYYSGSSFNFDVNLTDGQVHQLALYCLDPDSTERFEKISIVDAVTGNLIDFENMANFHTGLWAVWNVQGHILVQVMYSGGLNAIVNGLFLAP